MREWTLAGGIIHLLANFSAQQFYPYSFVCQFGQWHGYGSA
jgi:hypothetical protein